MIYINQEHGVFISGVLYYEQYINPNNTDNNPTFREWITSVGGKIIEKNGILCVAFEECDSELATLFKLKYMHPLGRKYV